jgi:tetratricopeptide (TPR) repeat protein
VLSPLRFRSAEARARAEAVSLAYARAYGALVEPEQHALHHQRRVQREASRTQAAKAPRAAQEQFKIRTDLLDAKTQFDEGRRRLDAGQLASAIEHLEFAADIEPTGRTLAYLALARFRVSPDFALERSLELLADACARDPQCEEAWAFRADLALSASRRAEAEDAYRQASRINPAQSRYRDALRGLATKR